MLNATLNFSPATSPSSLKLRSSSFKHMLSCNTILVSETCLFYPNWYYVIQNGIACARFRHNRSHRIISIVIIIL